MGSDPWWEKRSCAKVDTLVFFPEAFEGRSDRRVARAKRICGRCPVRMACLDYALTEQIPQGIFGGLTAEERQGLVVLRPHG